MDGLEIFSEEVLWRHIFSKLLFFKSLERPILSYKKYSFSILRISSDCNFLVCHFVTEQLPANSNLMYKLLSLKFLLYLSNIFEFAREKKKISMV